MAITIKSYNRKYLVMKPEVTKIFDDLAEYLDYCRIRLLKFDPKDMYKSVQYREFDRRKRIARR